MCQTLLRIFSSMLLGLNKVDFYFVLVSCLDFRFSFSLVDDNNIFVIFVIVFVVVDEINTAHQHYHRQRLFGTSDDTRNKFLNKNPVLVGCHFLLSMVNNLIRSVTLV